MTTGRQQSGDWEQAAEAGNVHAAAELSARALARNPGDPDLALAALVCQSNAGRAEEVFEIFLRDPTVAQDPKGFVALVFCIASTGALDIVDRYNLYPAMEQVLQWHPPLSEFSVRIAAQYLARDPGHIPSLKHLQALVGLAVKQQDEGLAGRLLMACPERLRPIVLRAFEGIWGGLPPSVLNTQARFDQIAMDAFLDAARAQPFQQVFPRENVVRRSGTGTGRMARLEPNPIGIAPAPLHRILLDRTRLAQGVRRLYAAAKAYLAAGNGFREEAFHKFAAEGVSPVLIVSTGRVGTRAIELLLNGSQTLAPFHSLSFHMENGDHNSILYRMLAGEDAVGGFEREIAATLTYRLSEFAYCHAMGKTPVLVNHLDTILVPIYLAAFPDARVIRMHRDPGKTLRSLAYKNQFGFRQLRHLFAGFDEQGKTFHYRRDTALSIEQECVWYMKATDMLADIYAAELTAPGRFLDLDMERGFALDGAVLDGLAAFLDDPGISSEACRVIFSERVNEKAHYSVDEADADPARLSEAARHWMAVLARDGGFPGA